MVITALISIITSNKDAIVSALIVAAAVAVAGRLSHGILLKMAKTIKLAIITQIKKLKMEKNTLFTGGPPIFPSVNGYWYTLDGITKTLFCGECHALSKHARLVRQGRFSKKYVCPICGEEYTRLRRFL
jgi:hypothetical protein